MTTITIKNGKKLPRTDFESLEELLDWAVDYFQGEVPLSPETIQKTKDAKKELASPDSTFRPAS
ncbi:MAG: hypothetical protein JJE55_04895 [Flavobacteriaceae bacterium]|nr:hypothetical protein [Flavobacteriaceae bacterium]